MTPLRRRMIEDMRLKNLAPRTIEAYAMRVATFARHFGQSPDALGRDEVRSYLLHLVQEKHVSWSVYNQTVAALRFLYEVTLDRDGVMEQRPGKGLKSRWILRLRPRPACRHLGRAPLEKGLEASLWRHFGFRLVFSPLPGRCKKNSDSEDG
jgi:hypothetical protein